MANVITGNALDKEIKNVVQVSERAGSAASENKSILTGANIVGEATDTALDALKSETKKASVGNILEQYKKPSVENIKLKNSLIMMARAPLLGEVPGDVKSMIYKIHDIPLNSDMQDHIEAEIDRNTSKQRQKELNDLMKPKEDKFDLVYKLAEKHISLASDLEKAGKAAMEAIAISKVPSAPAIMPVKQAIIGGDLFSIVGGALPVVMIFKMLCMKVNSIYRSH